MRSRPLISLLAIVAAFLAIALVPAASSGASEAEVTSSTPETTTSTPVEAPASTVTTETTTASPAPVEGEAALPALPEVKKQTTQGATPGANAGKRTRKKPSSREQTEEEEEEAAGRGGKGKHRAVSPSALTPTLPFALEGALGGVPSFFIESFRIPPFLLPVFQAAGTAYGIPWQVLAAINEVETDYGRDLSVSSAGAEGWMQFLPSSWAQYGVDANGDGYRDPYNPADAIFAAARYLRAAGGRANIRSAVFSYNHSPAYVDSVMLRAQLLGGTPAELLGAITGLTEARFPVHAAAHFSDGFPTVTTGGAGASQTLTGTTIYADAGAPVIAVQDGEIIDVGDSPALGHYISLRDAFGNTYTYAELSDVSSVYPVLEPHGQSRVSTRIGQSGDPKEPAPSGPATAGAQPRSPLSAAATVSGLALGAAASLEPAPAEPAPAAPAPGPAAPAQPATEPQSSPGEFTEGSNDVFLHSLQVGVQVIAGTVLGHVGAQSGSASVSAPHMLFQIRPAGAGAPLIDPKPILDGWVALENTSVFHAKGENPFLATSPTVGQVLLESKQQLEPQVLHDSGVTLGDCGRADIQGGRVDRRILALLEYLAVSGLDPTASGLPCSTEPAPGADTASVAVGSASISIDAINGVAIAGHQGNGSIADTTVRKLLMLEGLAKPRRILSLQSYPGASGAVASPTASDAIVVSYETPAGKNAKAAAVSGSVLSPSGWIKLIDRLGEIPDPTVGHGPSSAAIADAPGAASGSEGSARGNN